MLQPLDFNAPLLVFFRKVCYPQYVLHCSGRDGAGAAVSGVMAQSSEKVVVNSRIFASMKAFQQWEGAVELHAACLDRVSVRCFVDSGSGLKSR